MRGQDDATLQLVILDDVMDQKIVATFRSLVTDQHSIGIAGNKVAGHDGVHRAYQVKRSAAVARFIVLISAASGLVRAANGRPRKYQPRGFIIVQDMIVANRDVCSTHHQNSFIQSILHREPGNGYVVKTSMVETVHKDAVCESGSVNDGFTSPGADERKRNANNHGLLVGASLHVNDCVSRSMVYGPLDGGVAPLGTTWVDAQCRGCSRLEAGRQDQATND